MAETSDNDIGKILIKRGSITEDVLQEFMAELDPEKKLEEVLIEKKLVPLEEVVHAKNWLAVGQEIEIPGYLFGKKLGEGGMGSVYKGKQMSLQRTVAIKLLDVRLSQDDNFLQRFIQEARVLAHLNHRNIVKGIDFGDSNGIYYYVMEYLKGRNIQAIVDKKGPLKEKTAISIMLQIAHALDYIEQKQLIHRDIKPENILLCRNGLAKLCDLGLAKWKKQGLSLTSAGAIIGTPYYLSPEQAQGESDIDIRSDIYSLGATLYFMLTGKPPYDGDKATVIHFRHIYDPPPKITEERPDLPKQWDKFFEYVMAKDKENRVQRPRHLLKLVTQLCKIGTFSSSTEEKNPALSEKSKAKPEQEKPTKKYTSSTVKTSRRPVQSMESDNKTKNMLRKKVPKVKKMNKTVKIVLFVLAAIVALATGIIIRLYLKH